MKVWVQVVESRVALVDIAGYAPYIDDLQEAVKLKMPNEFKMTDSCRIIIRDPVTKVEIPATKLLTLTSTNGKARGSSKKPFIIDAPKGIWPNTYSNLYFITFQ